MSLTQHVASTSSWDKALVKFVSCVQVFFLEATNSLSWKPMPEKPSIVAPDAGISPFSARKPWTSLSNASLFVNLTVVNFGLTSFSRRVVPLVFRDLPLISSNVAVRLTPLSSSLSVREDGADIVTASRLRVTHYTFECNAHRY